MAQQFSPYSPQASFSTPGYTIDQYGNLVPIQSSNLNFNTTMPNTLGIASPTDLSSIAGYGASPAGSGNFTSDPTVPGSQSSIFTNGTPQTTPASGALGWNIPTAQLGLGALAVAGNLYGAITQSNIAKDQLAYTEKIGNANLANQMKSYNTNLTSNANADSTVGGWSPATTAAYISKNQLTGS